MSFQKDETEFSSWEIRRFHLKLSLKKENYFEIIYVGKGTNILIQ